MKKSSSTGSLTSLASVPKVPHTMPPCSPMSPQTYGQRRSSSCCALDTLASSVLMSMDAIAKELVLETQLESVLHIPSHVAGMCLLDNMPHVFPSSLINTSDHAISRDMAMCLATPPDPPEKSNILDFEKGKRNTDRFSELLACRRKRRAGRWK
jgi:hypothetical protein